MILRPGKKKLWLPSSAPFYKAAGGGGGGGSLLWGGLQSSAVSGGVPAPSATMFTSQAIGTAASDRVVVVTISWTGSSSSNMDIPTNGVAIGGVTATRAVYSRPGSKGTAVYFALVTTGTTADIGITGYSNGWVDEIIINTASFTGSAAASVLSANNDVTPAYPNGLTTTPTITIPTGGPGVIAEIATNAGSAGNTTWSGATLVNDQYDSNPSGITGSMARVSATGTVSQLTVSGGQPTGWVAAVFQP
jgi:hypothetical protein